MIGVTAAASAGIYFSRGDVPPLVAAPVALGVLLGAFVGTHLLTHLSNKALRLIFLPVMAVIALEMVLRGAGCCANLVEWREMRNGCRRLKARFHLRLQDGKTFCRNRHPGDGPGRP